MWKLQCAEKLTFLPHENMENPPQKLANLQKCSCFLYLVQICGYIVHTGYPIYVVVAIFELDMQAMLIRSNVRGTNYSVLGWGISSSIRYTKLCQVMVFRLFGSLMKIRTGLRDLQLFSYFQYFFELSKKLKRTAVDILFKKDFRF